MKYRTLIISASAILVLAACAPTGRNASLEDTLWILESYQTSEGETVDAIPDSGARVEFEDGEVSGTSGCNRFFGPYEVDGNSISIGPLAVTERFCEEPEGIMEQEQEYLAALGTVATWSIDGDQLDLRTAGGSRAAAYTAGAPAE